MSEAVLSAEAPTPEDAVERYGLWIKRTALHMNNLMPWAEIDELVQWGVVGLLEARERFDPSRGKPFSAFATRRIRGAMIDSLRRDGNQARRVTKAPDAVMDSTVGQSEFYTDPLQSLLKDADQAQVAAALADLPERQKLVLQLFFVEGLNNREIAHVLEVSEAYASKARKAGLQSIAKRLNLTEQLPGSNE